MSSPTETPQAIPKSTFDRESGDLVIGGVRVPLPRWAKFLLGILAILSAAVPVVSYFTGSSDPQSEKSAGMMTVSANQAPTPPPASPENQMSETAMIYFVHSQKHADEDPKTGSVILDSPDLGKVKVRFFRSDHCLQVIRTSPGPNAQTVTNYVLESKREDRAPGNLSQAVLSRDMAVDQDLLETQIEPASFAPGRVETTTASPLTCIKHDGEFRSSNGEKKGCWLQVWRLWPDGCQHYQWFNTCTGAWDSLPDGKPNLYWTKCVH